MDRENLLQEIADLQRKVSRLEEQQAASLKVETALRESEGKLFGLVGAVTDKLSMIDENHTIVFASTTTLEKFGHDIVGQKCYRAFRRRDTVCDPCIVSQTFADGMIHELEQDMITRDNRTINCWTTSNVAARYEDGRPRLVVEFSRDITRQKQAEAKLKRLCTAINQSDEAVMITDRNGAIQYVNPAFTDITGYEQPEVIGKNPGFLMAEKNHGPFHAEFWSTIKVGSTWKGYTTSTKKDGSHYTQHATISPVTANGGTVTNFVAVMRDVTVELNMEEQIRQLQKMEAIGVLAGGIAHDFNNILGIIITNAEMAIEDALPGSETLYSIRQVLGASYRAKELIRQILLFSRRSEKELMPLHLGPLVNESLKMLRSTLPASIEIKQNIKAVSDAVLCDPIQIHQLLMNLCTNSAQAMQEAGGTLAVTLTEARNIPDKIAGYMPGPCLVLTVSDTGCGISPDNIKKIFDPYFTTKNPGEGTGLGLSVVLGIVRSLQGEIIARSTPGRGTTFKIYLPRAVSRNAKSPDTKNGLPRGEGRILFIDDEAQVGNAASRRLTRLGYTLTTETTPQNALAVFRSDPAAFDLVITDKTMPDMNGFELAAAMKEIRPDIPVIICSGYFVPEDTTLSKKLGIAALLPKPVTKKDLAEAIQSVLDDTKGEYRG